MYQLRSPVESAHTTPRRRSVMTDDIIMTSSDIQVVYFSGGYDFPNTARFWTLCTALTLGLTLSNDIPEHKV